MQRLEPVWPAVLGAYVDQLHELTDHLGHNQDLEVLRTTLRPEPDLSESGRDRQDVLGQVKEQPTVLRAEAQELGRTVFSNRPRALRSRLAALWSAWHTG